jgi:hypothetical protein
MRLTALILCLVFATAVRAQSGDEIDPWETLELTTREAKVASAGVPTWIPIAGGAALLGAGILILSDDDQPSHSPAPTPLDSCNASFSISTTPAICQLGLGTAILNYPLEIEPIIIWNNGLQNDSLANLAPGEIYAAVVYNNGNCVDTVHAEILSAPHDFNLTTSPLKPNCTSIGDMEISFTPLDDAETTMNIVGPSGNTSIPDPEPSSLLSDYLEPESGLYSFTLTLDNTKLCSDAAEANLETIQLPLLILADLISPSGPDASDGAIFLETLVDLPPWTLYMNEVPIQNGDGTFAAIEGLSPGLYILELADARGCLSSPQAVELVAGGRPPQTSKFSFQLLIRPLPSSSSRN